MNIDKIRNFCIIAHIDHGKSTLADRLLEVTGSRILKMSESRVMDMLEVEQERGITIKMQSARMKWDNHILNLIDTPGHVDFSYEVSRSVVASEGALLIVDAKQGIQAQTISNVRLAREHGLEIIPVLSKIDLPNLNIGLRKKQIQAMLKISKDDIFCVSGKTGEGVKDLLDAIVLFVPSPQKRVSKSSQGLVYDVVYDEYKGVVILVRLFGGKVGKGQRLHILGTDKSFVVKDVGYLKPEFYSTSSLSGGEVGYIETGMKDVFFINVGQTICLDSTDKPLYLYKRPVPRIFATVFPTKPEEFPQFAKSLDKLSLNDSSLSLDKQKSEVLGAGFRIGFLGLLHMEVFQERLEKEFDSSLLVTSPSVRYICKLKNGNYIDIETPSDYPSPHLVEYFKEPYVNLKVLTPVQYMSQIMDLCQNKRGKYLRTDMNDNMYSIDYVTIQYDMPLAEVISGFFDKLKSISRGYASMNYNPTGYRVSDLVKVLILVNKQEVATLSFLEVRDKARDKAIKFLHELKNNIPRHQFKVPLQAIIGSKIIAREDIRAFRKDVLQKLHASDPSRRAKLLNNQKRGKDRMRKIGNVNIPQKAFLSILKV